MVCTRIRHLDICHILSYTWLSRMSCPTSFSYLKRYFIPRNTCNLLILSLNLRIRWISYTQRYEWPTKGEFSLIWLIPEMWFNDYSQKNPASGPVKDLIQWKCQLYPLTHQASVRLHFQFCPFRLTSLASLCQIWSFCATGLCPTCMQICWLNSPNIL